MTEPRFRINEIFYSIQGESTFAPAGPASWCALTGCQMRCLWCDTTYAFYEGEWMTLDEVLDEVAAFDCPLVEVTGGEPLLQPAVHAADGALCDAGYEVLLETGGGLDIAPVDPRVRRIVDVKCPGSRRGREQPLAEPRAAARRRDELKFVLAGRADYDWARDLVRARELAEPLPGPLLAGARRARARSPGRLGARGPPAGAGPGPAPQADLGGETRGV